MNKKQALKRSATMYKQVQQFGPLVLRHTDANRLLQLCRVAMLNDVPLQYKLLSENREEGNILLWVKGQEELADKLAARHGQHLPKAFRIVVQEV